MDFTLEDIAAILAFREKGEPPCSYVLTAVRQQVTAIEARIQDLKRLNQELEVAATWIGDRIGIEVVTVADAIMLAHTMYVADDSIAST